MNWPTASWPRPPLTATLFIFAPRPISTASKMAAISKHDSKAWLAEAGGCALLAALLAYFLKVSWRKWPDPMIDSGPQWYAAWRVARGGMPFREMVWTYGPL